MCGGFHNAAGGDILIDHKVLEGYLRKLYGGKFDVSKEIEPTIWREVLRLLNEATVEGLSQSQLPPTHEQEFYKELRHSNEVFAAFKVHKMGNLMALKLTDEDGKLKPYRQWKEDIKGITNHFLNAWLKTEYNTAVIRAHNAADWRQFERNKDIMPNLRWMPTVSPNPEAEHRVFWERKLTRPIDDPFWNKHRPGNRWNCKCSLEATDEPITPLPTEAEIRGDQPQRGLENNPGKDGQLFSKKHPYFPKNCRECGLNKGKGIITNVVDAFLNRAEDCYNCRFIDGCTERATEKQHIDSAAMARKREAKEQNLMPKLDRQPCEYVQKGALNRTMKVRNKLFTHCHHDYDVDAAIFIWNNPQNLRFVRSCELGEGKDMSIPKNQENIRRKREEYHFVYFNQYEFLHNKRTFIVKTAVCEEDYEQFYSLYEK